MRTTDIHAFKKIASKNFSIKDVEFLNFTDIGKSDITHSVSIDKGGEQDDQLIFDADMFEIVADLKIKYEGNPPESYRVLNSIIMDWVDDNEKDLKNTLNPELKGFLNKEYPEIDTSDLDEDFDDYIWEDQVDYHPSIEEEAQAIHFTLELVLSVEEE
jgi:hypothetical protein